MAQAAITKIRDAEERAAQIIRNAHDEADKIILNAKNSSKEKLDAHRIDISNRLLSSKNAAKIRADEQSKINRKQAENECEDRKKQYQQKSKIAYKAVYDAFTQ